MVILETKRLTIRRFEMGDLDALFRLYRDPEMRRHFPDGTLTLDQTRDELEWFLQGHPDNPDLGLWATLERNTGTFLGRCGLLPWTIDGKPEIELAYMIDRGRWGEGLATEAALGIIQHAREQLGLKRLICLIMPGNVASTAVATKVGMVFERQYTGDFGRCHIYGRSLQTPDPPNVMKVKIATHPVMDSRPCNFCLCLQGGSVFADFDLDASGNVFLRGISFDGYGYCGPGDTVRTMNAEDSRLLKDAVARGALEATGVDDVLLRYLQANKDLIWSDALEAHGLL